ncbi:hypothetical protein FRC16_006509, partial [Serendipita sp. 398]
MRAALAGITAIGQQRGCGVNVGLNEGVTPSAMHAFISIIDHLPVTENVGARIAGIDSQHGTGLGFILEEDKLCVKF